MNKDINEILSLVINDIHKGQEKIINITESLKSQYKKYEEELREINEEINELVAEVIQLEKEDKKMRRKLADVSANFQEDDSEMKKVYEEALNVRVEYVTKQKEENRLKSKRSNLEKLVKENRNNIQDADSVIEQVSVALNYLKRDVGGNIDDVDEKNKIAYSVRFTKAQEKERNRIAREIHDGPAQYLASTIMRLDFCKMLLSRDLEKGLMELDDLKGNVKKTLKEVRGIILDLKPPFLNGVTLENAIYDLKEAFQDDTNINFNVKMKVSNKVIEYVLEVAIYRMIQEILHNIKKHSNAQNASLKLEIGYDNIYIDLQDDGKGFDVEKVIRDVRINNKHYGILGIYDRVYELNGEITIESSENEGTKYKIKLPINRGK
ncbi:MAG: sensor histidine kinase [Clostridium sp.]|nr:sensor histidine kinase [Clostridium sp.]